MTWTIVSHAAPFRPEETGTSCLYPVIGTDLGFCGPRSETMGKFTDTRSVEE